MSEGPPDLVALDPDESTARDVGAAEDGRRFFLTRPFVPGGGDAPGREFLALYLFDGQGRLIEARIEDLGTREGLDEAKAAATRGRWLASLGSTTPERIWVAPFRIERFGVEFGFIPQEPEDPDDDWCVVVEPGDFMCFWPPWTTGDYDT